MGCPTFGRAIRVCTDGRALFAATAALVMFAVASCSQAGPAPGVSARTADSGPSSTADDPGFTPDTVTESDNLTVIDGDAVPCTPMDESPSTDAASLAPSLSGVDSSEMRFGISFATDRGRDTEIVLVDADGSNPVWLTDNGLPDEDPVWSPDGTRIAYTSDSGDGYDIVVMDADGSNPVWLTDNSFHDSDPVWSPDGTRIAYTRDLDNDSYNNTFVLFVMDADGTNQVKLTGDGTSPVWSPDGTRIAYISSDIEIFVADINGTEPLYLTDGTSPVWSPDGTRIAYKSGPGIFVMSADGTNRVQLTDSGYGPVWSPDGTRIAYIDEWRDNGWYNNSNTTGIGGGRGASQRYARPLWDSPPPSKIDIFVMDASGTNQVQLTGTRDPKENLAWSPNGDRILFSTWNPDEIFVMNADGTDLCSIPDGGRDPTWSPSGNSIIYSRSGYTDRHDMGFDRYVMNMDGTNQRKLLDSGADAVWSPDGTRITYTGPGYEIFLANADGSNIRQLTETVRYFPNSYGPLWSPDGTRIAYISSSDESSSEIYVMNADGSDQTQLTYNDSVAQMAWSPDSSHIAYSVSQSFGPLGPGIFMINADGTGKVQLTHSAEWGAWCPAWWPDGTRIAFYADGDVYIVGSDGSDQVQITEDGETGCPVWSPDGTRIAYTRRPTGATSLVMEILVMDADGSDRVRLTENGAGPVWSPDGTRIAFSSERDGDWEIFVMNADGTDQVQLTHNDTTDVGPVWLSSVGQ